MASTQVVPARYGRLGEDHELPIPANARSGVRLRLTSTFGFGKHVSRKDAKMTENEIGC